MKIVRHPNGFLRVEFFRKNSGESDRLHVWDSPGEDSDIHQHSYDFTSEVYSGVMNEELYSYREDPNGAYERWSVICGADEAGVYHVDVAAEKIRVTPVLLDVLTHRAGETYERPAADFHKVIAATTPLITRVSAGPVHERRHFFLREIAAHGDT